MGEFLTRTLGEGELTPVEKQYWIQSGLALSPLMATCTQYSLDFCLAWALIGEWTSRILFPVPKGSWPRHGHAGALLPEYRARSPRIVAWARACFEQGALPSLLLLQGLVPIFTLPGDKMFQSTGVQQGRHRPPVIHYIVKRWGAREMTACSAQDTCPHCEALRHQVVEIRSCVSCARLLSCECG